MYRGPSQARSGAVIVFYYSQPGYYRWKATGAQNDCFDEINKGRFMGRPRFQPKVEARIYLSGARSHLRIAKAQRTASLIGDDLLESLAEIEFEIRPFRPAEMGGAEDVRHGQERMIRDRLAFVDVDRGIAGPSILQRGEQIAGRDQFRPRGVDD